MKYLNYLKGSVLLLILLSTCMLVAQEEAEEPTKVSKKELRIEGHKALTTKYEGIRDQMAVAYEAGELHRVIDILELKCLTKAGVRKGQPEVKQEIKKISKGLRSEVFEFAALAYLALDQPGDAEYYVRKVFALNHAKDFSAYWLDIREAYSEVYYTAPRLSVGIRGSLTSSSVDTTKAYSVFKLISDEAFESTNYDQTLSAVAVSAFVELGLSKSFSAIVYPTYYGTGYSYKTTYKWKDTFGQTAQEGAVTIAYQHDNELAYLELPLLFRYKYIRPRSFGIKSGQRLKPYLQAGAFVGMRLSASKSVEAIVADNLAGSIFEFRQAQQTFGTKDLYMPYQWGLTGSLGLTYEFDLFRLGIDYSYRHGMNEIVNKKERLSQPTLTHGVYDILDDVKLRSTSISVDLSIPLTYKAYKN